LKKEPGLKNKAEVVLRNQFFSCLKDIAKKFQDISDMPKEEAGDYLLKLRQEVKILIKLNTVDDLIKHTLNGFHRVRFIYLKTRV
jgi:hypothetical protein